MYDKLFYKNSIEYNQLSKKILVNTLNDTLEEQLRHMLVDKNNECNSLKAHIKMLEEAVAQEQEAKYRAYVKIADLTQKINQGKNDLVKN